MAIYSKLLKTAVVAVSTILSLGNLPAAATPSNAPPDATAEMKLENGTLYIDYRGTIVGDMARFLEEKFRKHGDTTHKIVLAIHSQGGEVEAGERVIQLLKQIKQTHRLVTAVMAGRTCASMCVPIYLQGQERFAAASSLWLFHDAAKLDKKGDVIIDREETLRIYRRYFVPAGVSVAWLNNILGMINQSDFWQTGQDLVRENTGIVTQIIGNQQARNVKVSGEGVPRR